MMMDKGVAIGGNALGWLTLVGSVAAQLTPIAHLIAAMLAGSASVATALYFLTKLHRERQRRNAITDIPPRYSL